VARLDPPPGDRDPRGNPAPPPLVTDAVRYGEQQPSPPRGTGPLLCSAARVLCVVSQDSPLFWPSPAATVARRVPLWAGPRVGCPTGARLNSNARPRCRELTVRIALPLVSEWLGITLKVTLLNEQ
jgi:hypothetical protein